MAPTDVQKQLGKWLGFDEAEIANFIERAAARDKTGRGWDNLFPNGDAITLPLLADGEVPQSLDERLNALIERYNATATEDKKVARIDEDPKKLQRGKNNKFLKAIDEAEAWLLRHDLEMEWDKQKRQKENPEQQPETTTQTAIAFSELQNRTPISVDGIDPNCLRLVVSRDPIDIAGMSTNRRWRSCMSKDDGINYHYVPKEIKAGSLVTYLVHEEDVELKYPLMRVLLKPFHNDKGETILVPNHVYAGDVKGNNALKAALLHTVRQFVGEHNKGKTGIFQMDNSVYADRQETTLNLGTETLSGNTLALAIADAIPKKITEYVTEIETHPHLANQYIQKLKQLYAEPEIAAIAYLRNLRDMNMGQQLPKPSDVMSALQDEWVLHILECDKIFAFLYTKGAAGWNAFMKEHYPDTSYLNLTNHREIGDVGLSALAQSETVTDLSLWGCSNIGDMGAVMLSTNDNITGLDLGYCKNIGNVGALAIAKNTTLVNLELHQLIIAEDVEKMLVEGLKNNKNLLRYAGRSSDQLSSHLADNRQKATEYGTILAGIVDFKTITPEDKQNIASRANAILEVAGEMEDLSPDQQSRITSHIRQIRSELQTSASDRKLSDLRSGITPPPAAF